MAVDNPYLVDTTPVSAPATIQPIVVQSKSSRKAFLHLIKAVDNIPVPFSDQQQQQLSTGRFVKDFIKTFNLDAHNSLKNMPGIQNASCSGVFSPAEPKAALWVTDAVMTPSHVVCLYFWFLQYNVFRPYKNMVRIFLQNSS